MDFLFPSDRPSRRARRHQPRLPDELFSLIVCYQISTQEEAAASAYMAKETATAQAPCAFTTAG